MEPFDVSAAKALSVENICVKPVIVLDGASALLPPLAVAPQEIMEPSVLSAAKAPLLEKMRVKPVVVGAPFPPYKELPHAVMLPLALSAAKAFTLFAFWPLAEK